MVSRSEKVPKKDPAPSSTVWKSGVSLSKPRAQPNSVEIYMTRKVLDQLPKKRSRDESKPFSGVASGGTWRTGPT